MPQLGPLPPGLKCAKCGSAEVQVFTVSPGPFGSGPGIQLGATMFSGLSVDRLICTSCGYIEDWLPKAELARLRRWVEKRAR